MSKTPLLIIPLIITLVIVGFIIVNLTNTNKMKIYNETKGIWYQSIQKAINEASQGDKLRISPGIYYENIVVNKSITLYGSKRDEVIIEPSSKSVIIFNVISYNVTIRSLTVRNAHFGIYLFYSNNNKIVDIKSINCKLGVFVRNSNRTLIRDCVIVNATVAGIEIYHSSGNILINNTITGTISDYGGIFLATSDTNEIKENSVLNNSCGMWIQFSSNNSIYNNNFIDNDKQIVLINSINKWDKGAEIGGNYWSDYKGEDLNGDGIGDDPYLIDEENVDHYPLIEPWSS